MEEKVSQSFQNNNNNNVFIFDCFLNNWIEFELEDLQSKQLKEILSIMKSQVKFERLRDFIIIFANEGKLEVIDSIEKHKIYIESHQEFIVGGFYHTKFISPQYDHIRRFYYTFYKKISERSLFTPIPLNESSQNILTRKELDIIEGKEDNKELTSGEPDSPIYNDERKNNSSKVPILIDTYRDYHNPLEVPVSATEFINYGGFIFLVFGDYIGKIKYISLPINGTNMKSSIEVLASHSNAKMLVRRIHFMEIEQCLLTCSDDTNFKVWKIDYKTNSLSISSILAVAPTFGIRKNPCGCLHNFSLISSKSKSKYFIAFATEKEGLVMANLDLVSVKIDFLKETYKLEGNNKAMSVIILQDKNFKSTFIVAGFMNSETAIWEVNATKEKAKFVQKSEHLKEVVYSFQTYQPKSNIFTLLCGTEKGSLVKLEVEITSENGEIVNVEDRIPNYRNLPTENERNYSSKRYNNSMAISKDERINQILIDKSQDPSFAYLCTFDSYLYKVPINYDTTSNDRYDNNDNNDNNEEVKEQSFSVFSFRDDKSDNQTLKKNEVTRLRSISIFTDSKNSRRSYLAIGGEYNKKGVTGRVVIIEV